LLWRLLAGDHKNQRRPEGNNPESDSDGLFRHDLLPDNLKKERPEPVDRP
jgi:hypothetical protein